MVILKKKVYCTQININIIIYNYEKRFFSNFISCINA